VCCQRGMYLLVWKSNKVLARNLLSIYLRVLGALVVLCRSMWMSVRKQLGFFLYLEGMRSHLLVH